VLWREPTEPQLAESCELLGADNQLRVASCDELCGPTGNIFVAHSKQKVVGRRLKREQGVAHFGGTSESNSLPHHFFATLPKQNGARRIQPRLTKPRNCGKKGRNGMLMGLPFRFSTFS